LLAVLAPQRIPGKFSDIRTLKEVGYEKLDGEAVMKYG
jgi:tripartite-type tricarboxylate transporter receptor subunit TctC